ncbi:MAG: RPB7/RPC8 family DNA-directed RNA polymerase subunit [Nanoarchaeota archaeon]
MFYKMHVKDHIRVPPSKMDVDIEKSMIACIKSKYEGYISKDVGIVIDVINIRDIDEGVIIPGDGAFYYKTEFDLLTYIPELHEVVRGKIKVTIVNGLIDKIEGTSDAKLLAETLEELMKKAKFPENVKRISEIGIGINPNSRLIGPTIVDEKAINTAHIANGSNHWFNGPIITNVHLDHVFRDPEIYLDGSDKNILK